MTSTEIKCVLGHLKISHEIVIQKEWKEKHREFNDEVLKILNQEGK